MRMLRSLLLLFAPCRGLAPLTGRRPRLAGLATARAADGDDDALFAGEPPITATSGATVKLLKALHERRGREAHGLVLLEGERLVGDWLSRAAADGDGARGGDGEGPGARAPPPPPLVLRDSRAARAGPSAAGAGGAPGAPAGLRRERSDDVSAIFSTSGLPPAFGPSHVMPDLPRSSFTKLPFFDRASRSGGTSCGARR